MSFEIPKITTLPTVAETAEAGGPSNTDQASSFVTVNVKKYAGQQQFSVELFDRSSPLFITELMTNMAAQYAAATDKAVYTALASGATADSTTTKIGALGNIQLLPKRHQSVKEVKENLNDKNNPKDKDYIKNIIDRYENIKKGNISKNKKDVLLKSINFNYFHK